MKIAQGSLEAGRVRVQGLVLGKPWAVRCQTHEEVRKRFIVRCEIECNLVSMLVKPIATVEFAHSSVPVS